ncbi:MAG: DUF2520 domain-containing protein [Myxococcales bacterium]|nr:DUF2520 domain-containing protein [Myxococcales bacterium]
MNVFVVGAGRVGRALLILCRESGHTITGSYNLTEVGAKRTTEITGIPTQYGATLDVSDNTELLWITTSDEHIASAAHQVTIQNPHLPKTAWVHCSGALAADVLREAVPSAWSVAGAHPLQSFVNPQRAADAAKSAAWFVEGEPDALSRVTTFLLSLGVLPRPLPAHLRPLYHVAGVLASNAAIALFSAAASALTMVGLTRNDAVTSLLPLWQTTIDNVAEKGLPEALTGPIARGDVSVVRAHLSAMELVAPELISLYRELGIRTLQLASEANRTDPQKLNEIAQLLKD